jgi:hypothetical protein
MTGLVLAFDRDWTVDVNPHPSREAVPLEWVRHWAHATDHEVWAIGNQDLTDEADVPGIVELVERSHGRPVETVLGEPTGGRYPDWPSRRERLRLLADLFPDAPGYVVVDDLDLSDVAGWDHYHAWEFVPAVTRGAVHPSIEPPRGPRPDGGRPAGAGIAPTDAAALSSFLEEHGDAPGFELAYTGDGVERTRLVHDVSPHARSFERPAAAPAVRCTPVAPNADPFTVRVDAVDRLSVAEPPSDLYLADARTPAERATGLRRLSEARPEAVRVSSVLALLDGGAHDPYWQRDALRAIRHLAAARPDECAPAVPILRPLLAGDDVVSPADALAALRSIGEDDPMAIAPAIAEITPYLTSDGAPAHREAARCLAAVAGAAPEDVVDAVPALATVLEDEAPGQEYAVYALSQVTSEYPNEVRPCVGALTGVVLDESLDAGVRLNATAALGRIVGEDPSVALGVVDDVVALFDADHHGLRNNAVALVGDVATVHADVVEPHVDDLAPFLTADDAYARINASGALARVAADVPASVAHLEPAFLDCLSDDDPRVRENACWALGHLGASAAEAALSERATGDENADVRDRAAWALSRLRE